MVLQTASPIIERSLIMLTHQYLEPVTILQLIKDWVTLELIGIMIHQFPFTIFLESNLQL
jgi:hypothetical protein